MKTIKTILLLAFSIFILTGCFKSDGTMSKNNSSIQDKINKQVLNQKILGDLNTTK